MLLRVRCPHKLGGKNHNPKHHYPLYRKKQAWEEVAAWAWKQQRRQVEPLDPADQPHQIRMALPMDRPNRADPHNYTSYEVAWIIDGFVKVGLFGDDAAEYVTIHDPVMYQREGVNSPVIVAIDEPLPEEL